MRFRNVIPILAALSLLCAASLVRAQDAPQESSQNLLTQRVLRRRNQPVNPERTIRKIRTPQQIRSDQPTWDPLRAEKDLEVGQYYMRKGDVDAAIDRFEDATLAKPATRFPFDF